MSISLTNSILCSLSSKSSSPKFSIASATDLTPKEKEEGEKTREIFRVIKNLE
jgi:hypothetical protein